MTPKIFFYLKCLKIAIYNILKLEILWIFFQKRSSFTVTTNSGCFFTNYLF